MIGPHSLDTQEIEHLQNIVLNSQQSPPDNNSVEHSSSVPLDNAQRPPSSSHYNPHLSQLRMSDSQSQSEKFQFLGPDSFPYHQHRLGIATSSQIDEISPSPSNEYHPQLTSLSIPPQGGDGTPFKVPSFPSISSIIRNSRSSDEHNGSSVQTAGEASPRLSQFFQATQESPPQVHSSPHLPLLPDSVPAVPATAEPSPIAAPRGYTPIAVREARERARAEEEAAAEEARRRAEEDSFTEVPVHLRRRWAMEEKAHKIFEGLRNVKIDINRARGGNDSQIDDFLFGTKSRVDADGVRRVIKPEGKKMKKTVSDTGLDSDEDGESVDGEGRRRASTAPVREKKGSASTVISNSQPSNPSNGDTNGTVVKETPLECTPNSRPPTADRETLDSSQLIDIFEQQGNLVTPARPTTKTIPSSIPSSTRRLMETPAVQHIVSHHPEDSVPETSPVKGDGTESEEYRTALSSFPQEIDSSPVVVPGRPRAKNGFVASSIPHDMTQQRKRGRAPIIKDDISEEEDDDPPPPLPAISPPPRKRRRVKSIESIDMTKSHIASPSVGSVENGMEAHRVLARFKDQRVNFFPATVVEPPVATSPDQELPMETEVLVRFDDSTETMVQLRHIRRFHFVEGTTVKLWIDQYKKGMYVVQRVEYDPNEPGKTDINNNNIVYVTLKKGPSTEQIRVPIDKVYVTGQLFAQFKEYYLFTSTSSRTKYSGLVSRQVSSSPHLVRGPIRPSSPLFQNMVFALSSAQPPKSSSAATSKETLTQLIVTNSGYVADEGLHDIFLLPDEMDGALVLKPEFADTTFCAVIAGGYSRKQKYLQALALGIPCLACRWIESCIQQNRIVDWRMYLLPAGDSTFLGGIKSMVVEPFPPGQLLSQRLATRYIPLQNEKILLITGRGKSADAKKAYHFIVHALGARVVFQYATLAEADAYLSQGGITLVIAEEADVRRFGKGHVSVRIRSFENVVQSLILGDFVDEI